MSEYWMLRCEFSKIVNNCIQHYTAYIPERFAHLHNIVDLEMKDGWDKGWKVSAVYDDRNPSTMIQERSNDYRTQRKASDI